MPDFLRERSDKFFEDASAAVTIVLEAEYEEFDEKPHRKPQLEVIYGGPGSGGITAIGLFDDNDDNEELILVELPYWFRASMPLIKGLCVHLMTKLSMEERRVLLGRIGICRRYRGLLASRWRFEIDEYLSGGNIRRLCKETPFASDTFSRFLDGIEHQAAWRLWEQWICAGLDLNMLREE